MQQALRKCVISALLIVHILLQPMAGGITAASDPIVTSSNSAPPTENTPISARSLSGITVQEAISATLAVTTTVSSPLEFSLAPLKAAISSAAAPTDTRSLVVTPLITASSMLTLAVKSISTETPRINFFQGKAHIPQQDPSPADHNDETPAARDAQPLYLPYVHDSQERVGTLSVDVARANPFSLTVTSSTPEAVRHARTVASESNPAYVKALQELQNLSTEQCQNLISVAASQRSANPKPFSTIIKLNSETSLQDLTELVERYNLRVTQLILVEGRTKGVYSVRQAETLVQAWESFERSFQRYKTLDQIDSNVPGLWKPAEQENSTQETRGVEREPTPSLQIAMIEVTGSAPELNALVQATPHQLVWCVQESTDGDSSLGPLSQLLSTYAQAQSVDSPSIGALSTSTWSPSHGMSWVVDDEYLISQFLWTNTDGFDNSSFAYEHDIWIADWDYLDCASNWSAITDLEGPVEECSGPFFSDLPGEPPFLYIDTRWGDGPIHKMACNWSDSNPFPYPIPNFLSSIPVRYLCGADEESYAVGTTLAQFVDTKRVYTVYFEVNIENSQNSSSVIEVKPQRGRFFEGSVEQYFCGFMQDYIGEYESCVFANATDTSLPAFTASRYTSGAPQYWGGRPVAPIPFSPEDKASVNGSAVSFSWSQVIGSSYQLQIALDQSFSSIVYDGNLGNYLGVNLSGMPDNGVQFWWRVRAWDPDDGWGDWSAPQSFTNGPSAAPATPSLDSPGHGSTVAQTDVAFHWNAVRAKEYQFQLALSNDFSASNLLIDASVSYPYSGIVINGLPDNGWEFWWRVRASNSLGSSGWSSPRSFVNGPSAIPGTPGLDSPGSGANVAGSEITFRWNPASRAKEYRFQLALTSDFSSDNLLVDTPIAYPYSGIVINGLPDNGWEFWWRVQAANSIGNSSWSTGWRVANGPSASPAVPDLDSPGEGANAAQSEVTFRWNSTPRARNYQFQLALSSDFSAETLLVDAAVSYPYIGIVINGLPDNGWEFWWRVKASNSKGDSEWSSARHFINGPSAAPAIPGLDSPNQGENKAESEVTFRWLPTARAKSYQFQLSLANDFSADNLLVDAPVSYPYIGIVISGLPDNGWEFWWRVKAANSLGSSGWSAARSFVNGPSASPAVPSLNAPADGGNVAQTDVTFRWEATARALKFQYQLALTSDFNADGLLVDTEVSYPYVGLIINGLPDNGWDFYWRVKAGNDKGWSGWSAVWRVTNGPSALPEPPALQTPTDGENISGILVEFRWTVGARSASQRLQLAVDSAFQQIVFDEDLGYYSGVNLTGFSDQGQVFWWRAKSSNALGESAWSESRSFVNGPGQRGQVEGVVSDGANPLSRAVVSIGAKAAMSDESGHYLLRNIPAGPQRITVQRQGFISANRDITLAEGETQTIDFVLVSDGAQAQIEVSPASLVFTGTSSIPLPADVRSAEPGSQEATNLLNQDVVPNQFVIGYKPGLRLLDIQQSIARLQQKTAQPYTTQIVKSHVASGRYAEDHTQQSSVGYIVVEVAGETAQFLNDIRQNPDVAFVHPRQYARALEEPNDPLYFLQHALPQVQLLGAWARASGAPRPIVAVVDTGIDYTHPDLAASFGPLRGYDFVDNDSDPMPDAVWESHATHVAGIIGASRNNGVGVTGAALVTLLSVRALDENGTGAQDDVADAINWAVTQGAQIVNLSLGGGSDPILESAVRNAWNHGVLLVAASGNGGANGISYPAAYPEVIAVGALNQANELASFSNYGSPQELVAPGTTILSTYPGNDYAVASGTSMASPLVAGVAALVLAQDPTLTNEQLRSILTVSADDLGAPGRDNTYGFGRVNALAALDRIFGAPNTQKLFVSNRGQRLLEVSDIAWQGAWLTATPRTFTVWPGTTQTVNVIVDGSLFTPAHYTDTITIRSNDPVNLAEIVDVAFALEADTLTYSVPLLPGWNLVSSPLQPVEASVEQVLASISGEFDLVYGYDGCDSTNPWKSYDPNAVPFANDLTQIGATTGHWIRSTSASTLLITGTVAGPAIPLCTGWNLVGYPSLHSLPVADATSSIAGCLIKIYAYDASDLSDPWKKYDPYAPDFANDLTQMTPGQGYWIQTSQNCVWTPGE